MRNRTQIIAATAKPAVGTTIQADAGTVTTATAPARTAAPDNAAPTTG